MVRQMVFGENDTIEYFFTIQKRKGQNTKMEENETTKLKRMTATIGGFTLWRLTCFVETFVRGSTFILRLNNSAKNLPQCKAVNS